MGHRYTLPAGKPALALACVAALIAVFTAGCSAPPSFTQRATAGPSRFHQVPSSPATGYAIVRGLITANGNQEFTIPARERYIVWLGCLGDGKAHLASAQLMPAGWGMPCDGTGIMTAFNFNLAHAAARPQVTLSVTAPPGATWEIRIEATGGH